MDHLNFPAKHESAEKTALKMPPWFKTLLISMINTYGADALKAIIDWLSAQAAAKSSTAPQA